MILLFFFLSTTIFFSFFFLLIFWATCFSAPLPAYSFPFNPKGDSSLGGDLQECWRAGESGLYPKQRKWHLKSLRFQRYQLWPLQTLCCVPVLRGVQSVMGAIIKHMFNIGIMRTEGGEVTRSEVLQIPRTILRSLDFIFYLQADWKKKWWREWNQTAGREGAWWYSHSKCPHL